MKVNIINRSVNALPQYETTGSAGMDLRANIEAPIELGSLERTLIPTGLFIELPEGYEAQGDKGHNDKFVKRDSNY